MGGRKQSYETNPHSSVHQCSVKTMLSSPLCPVVLFMIPRHQLLCYSGPSSFLFCIQVVEDQALPLLPVSLLVSLAGGKIEAETWRSDSPVLQLRKQGRDSLEEAAGRKWVQSDPSVICGFQMTKFSSHLHYTCLLESKPLLFWASVKMEAGWWGDAVDSLLVSSSLILPVGIWNAVRHTFPTKSLQGVQVSDL